MSLKCSPGPWEAVDRLTVRSRFVAGDADSGGWLVASLPAHASDDDARLIAAAPDLLDALKDAVCALEVSGKDFWATEKARAAIAKATGSAA